MTKPHEEEWFVEFGSVMVKTDDADGAFVMTTGGKSGRGARLLLASKAPKMARALLLLVGPCSVTKTHSMRCSPDASYVCASCQGRHALREAGVLE